MRRSYSKRTRRATTGGGSLGPTPSAISNSDPRTRAALGLDEAKRRACCPADLSLRPRRIIGKVRSSPSLPTRCQDPESAHFSRTWPDRGSAGVAPKPLQPRDKPAYCPIGPLLTSLHHPGSSRAGSGVLDRRSSVLTRASLQRRWRDHNRQRQSSTGRCRSARPAPARNSSTIRLGSWRWP